MILTTLDWNGFRILARLLGRFSVGVSVVTLPIGVIVLFMLISKSARPTQYGLPSDLSAIGVSLAFCGLLLARLGNARSPRSCVIGVWINALAWFLNCGLSVLL
jgi:hypothetical protein